MEQEIQAEQVCLAVLVHYLVHPPAVSQATGEAFIPAQVCPKLALFLLKQTRVRAACSVGGLPWG